MPVRVAQTHVGPLFRVGKRPDPLTWPTWERVGKGRFDDPRPPSEKRYRVLCAGERRACFLETLADFRPALRDLRHQVGGITAEWLASRSIARFVLDDADRRWRWLDLRAPETHQVLRREFADLLLRLDVSDFDISAATGGIRELTQAIGLWAYEQGYQGIVYCSRFDPARSCWALFEREGLALIREPVVQPLSRDDPDLIAVANLFGLSLP